MEPHYACNGMKDCLDGSDENFNHCGPPKCTENDFLCQNGNCIPLNWQCDEVIDCTDGEDEYGCENRECDESTRKMFKCNTGKCIPAEEQCDTIRDCTHGEDENLYFCEHRLCGENEFRCESGECLSIELICNGTLACEDGSENISICFDYQLTCDDEETKCSDGKLCIPEEWKCNKEKDCMDGSDEDPDICKIPELRTCQNNEFKCTNGKCISDLWKCDGDEDCKDGSDEDLSICGRTTCKENEFRCPDGICKPQNWTCDGTVDCINGSDEDSSICASRICKENQFQCSYGACIPQRLKCDRIKDCRDGSDENFNTCGNQTCEEWEFKCTDQECIRSELLCDNIKHCSDGSDEDPVTCASPVKRKCAPWEFTCANGKCIMISLICDNHVDCPNGSDETPETCKDIVCQEDEFKCNSGQCIRLHRKCNGIKNCLDASDEDPKICGQPPSSFINPIKPLHTQTCNITEFRCEISKTCVNLDLICNEDWNCSDGSDENPSMCEIHRFAKEDMFDDYDTEFFILYHLKILQINKKTLSLINGWIPSKYPRYRIMIRLWSIITKRGSKMRYGLTVGPSLKIFTTSIPPADSTSIIPEPDFTTEIMPINSTCDERDPQCKTNKTLNSGPSNFQTAIEVLTEVFSLIKSFTKLNENKNGTGDATKTVTPETDLIKQIIGYLFGTFVVIPIARFCKQRFPIRGRAARVPSNRQVRLSRALRRQNRLNDRQATTTV